MRHMALIRLFDFTEDPALVFDNVARNVDGIVFTVSDRTDPFVWSLAEKHPKTVEVHVDNEPWTNAGSLDRAFCLFDKARPETVLYSDHDELLPERYAEAFDAWLKSGCQTAAFQFMLCWGDVEHVVAQEGRNHWHAKLLRWREGIRFVPDRGCCFPRPTGRWFKMPYPIRNLSMTTREMRHKRLVAGGVRQVVKEKAWVVDWQPVTVPYDPDVTWAQWCERVKDVQQPPKPAPARPSVIDRIQAAAASRGSPAATKERVNSKTVPAWTRCVLRGQPTGAIRQCRTCKGMTRFKVFECPNHPEGVTMNMKTPAGPDCKECAQYVLPELRISAIVTARNEGNEVAETLKSLRAAGADELICVDDGSTDGSCAAEKLPAGTILIRNDESKGVGVARVQGIQRATGNVMAIFDGHVRVPTGQKGTLREACQEALNRSCVVVLTVEPLGDETHRKIGTGYGARLRLAGNGSHYVTDYQSKAPANRFSPIDGPIGAAYIASAVALKRIGGWLDLPHYGGCEQALALRCWFTDTPILVDRDCRSWHLFGSPHNYSSPPIWMNWLRIAFIHFEDRTFREFWRPNIYAAWPEAEKYWPAWEADPALLAQQRQFRAIKRHTDVDWGRYIGDQRLLETIAPPDPDALVSITMPAHNCGPFIAQAIESVQAQTWRNWQLIVVDDASTDDTLAVAQRYAAADKRIEVYHHDQRLGCPRARNEATKRCKGTFIARLDADDWDEPTRLQRSVEYLQAHPRVDVVSCRMWQHEGKKEPFVSPCSPVCASVVARRRVYERVKFREQLRNGSDTCWNREATMAGFKFVEITEPLYHYRYARPGSVTMTRKKVIDFWRLPESYFVPDNNHPERLRQLLRCIPDLFDYKSLLYIGANAKFHRLVPTFCLAGYMVDVVEPFAPYIEELQRLNAKAKYFRRIVHGDARALDASSGLDSQYDVVLWWHGPEHVDQVELHPILTQMSVRARKLAVIGAPHGRMEQDAIDGNDQQRHRWDCMPAAFEPFGWTVHTLWPKPHQHSHLIAWNRP